MVDTEFPVLSEPVTHAFRFMADLGIVALLFSIGLEGHPSALAARLPQAVVIWISNMTVARNSLVRFRLLPRTPISVNKTPTSTAKQRMT